MWTILKRRNFWIMVLTDTVLCGLAYYLAHWIRFDGHIPVKEWEGLWLTIIWVVLAKLVFLTLLNLYRGMWRYTSLYDLINLVKAGTGSSGLVVLIIFFVTRFQGFSRGVFILDYLLSLIFLGGARLAIRLYFQGRKTNGETLAPGLEAASPKRLLIIGAGDGGEKLLREINENPQLNYQVVGFLDDELSKVKMRIHGVSILGSVNEIQPIVQKFSVEEIIIAVPSASALEMRRFVNFSKASGVPFKTLPGMGELIEGRVKVSTIREVRYEDLLGRTEVDLNLKEISDYLNGKRILVTGAAGSIGSELCRQIAQFNPAELILVDKNESGLYEIKVELGAKHQTLTFTEALCRVQGSFLKQIFKDHRPQVVFHAAAYKHVPIMEVFPWEAVFNNIVATQVLLEICRQYGVERCVIVSTDKAVRPSNIMGASKRICELLSQAYSLESHCRFMAVRFGNVIGSIGSVVPLFRKQIAQGGPVTVTHKDMTRYFMTIPEAARLIIQAGAIGLGGEIFLLKMGTPIRIDSIARDMITLSGWVPDRDIEIKYIGLRAGEKLHEELMTEDELLDKTSHEKIVILRSQNGLSLQNLTEGIQRLCEEAETGNIQGIQRELKQIIPECQFEDCGPLKL